MKNKALNLPYKLLIILSIFAILPACSISDDDEDELSNSAPSVSVGEDQTVNQGATVDLVGVASDSDGSISSWLWKQTSGSHSVTIKNSTTSNAYFSAPTVDTETTLVFELEVKDNDGASVSDSMRVTVRGPDDSVNPLPDNFEAEAGDGQVTLTWTHHSGATYNIYRSSASDCELANYTSCADGDLFTSKSSGFVDDDLTNGTTYYYWIEAILDGVTYLSNDDENATPSVDEDDGIDLSDGLVAHYEFEGNADDSSGNGNHGEVIGGILTEDRHGDDNSAYYFDNQEHDGYFYTKDYIVFPEFALSSISISLWVKYIDNAHSGDHNAAIVSLGEWDTNILMLWTNADGDLRLMASENGVSLLEESITLEGVLSDSNWHHVAVVIDNDKDTVTVYFDGSEDAIEQLTGNIDIDNDTLYASLHKWDYGSSMASRFVGSLDDMRIYGRALNVAEVQELYGLNNNLADELVAHYEFDGNANDSSGNGNNGEVIGATLTEGRHGDDNSAYYFDNQEHDGYFYTKDYIVFPEFALSSISISLWVKYIDNAHSGDHNAAIVSLGEWDTNILMLWTNADGDLRLMASENGVSLLEESITLEGVLSDSNWHHVAVVIDNDKDTVTVYFDGSEDAIEQLTGNIDIDNDTLYASLHKWDYGSSMASRFVGSLDDMRIYGRALNLTEVQALYELGDD